MSPRSTVSPSSSTTTAPPSSTSFIAQSVTFISDDDAWVLGAVHCQKGWCPAIRHTTDRGELWTSVSAPSASIDTGTQGISDLRFADSLDGFAFGPGLWVTHNAGANWHQVSLPGSVLTLAAADRKVYAVVSCSAYPSCTNPARLYQTPAGTDAWQEVPGVALPPTSYSVVLQLQGRGVYLLVAGTSTFIRSYDGTNFQSLSDPCPAQSTGPAYSPGSFALSTASDLAVLCGDGVAAGSQKKEVYVSIDGGETYSEVAAPPFTGDASEIAAANPTTLVVSAQSGASWLYRATGADTTWTTPVSFNDGGVGVTDLGFTDMTHGVFIHGGPTALRILGGVNPPSGLGTLYLTEDAGATWHQVHISS